MAERRGGHGGRGAGGGQPGGDAALPIQQKGYTLTLELVRAVERFPRNHRFTLGDRIAGLGYDLVEQLAIARFSQHKREPLGRANMILERLRLLLRLSHDLRLISTNAYGHLTGQVEEVGRMLGGWRKQQSARPMPTATWNL